MPALARLRIYLPNPSRHSEMRYLLDTNILIAAMKGSAIVRARLELTPVNQILLSPIVLGELELGVEKSLHRSRNAACLASLIEAFELVPLSGDVSREYALIRAGLEKQGTPIGANDCWIAAQGVTLGATVVTDNQREFSRVPHLVIENWLDAG